MKGLKYGIFLLFLLIPIFVKAENCELGKVNLKAITIKNQSQTAEEIEKASIDQNKINLNVKFQEEGDYITYNLFVQNNSSEDFSLNTDKWNINSDYIEYTVETEEPIIKANEGKMIELKVSYKNEIDQEKFENGIFNENKAINLKLLSEEGITNPETGTSQTIFSLLCIIVGCIIIWQSIREGNLTKKTAAFMLGMMILVPSSVLAACQCNMEINSHVTIEQENSKICIITGKGTKETRLRGNNISKREITKEDFNRFLENSDDVTPMMSEFAFITKEDIENYSSNYQTDQTNLKETEQSLIISVPRDEIHDSSEGCYVFSKYDISQ